MWYESGRSMALVTLISTIMFSNGAVAAITILRAGAAGASNVLFEVDRAKAPSQIVLKTEQAGVAGSVLDVLIDGKQKPALHHVFAEDECKFVNQQSRCEVSFAAGSPEFADLVKGLVKGWNAKVTVADAGVMKMDHVVSLKGLARLLGR